MILRNLKLGLRNIWKNRLFSFINLLGISIGLAITMLILFWVNDEISINKFHKDIDHIYTVYEHQQYSNGEELYTHCTPAPLGNYLKENFSEVKYASTFFNTSRLPLVYNGKRHIDGPVFFANPDFLDIFSFNLLEGDKNALNEPNNIFITQDIADYLFESEPAIGKTIRFDQSSPLTIAGIIDTRLKQSSMDFKILGSSLFVKEWGVNLESWNSNWPKTCIKLHDGTDVAALNLKVRDIIKEHQDVTTAHLFPFKKEHLYSYSGKNNKVMYIYLFLSIAGIIILIASINFINFSTARSEQRRPEIGVLKTLGAKKTDIFNQFAIEKGILILISLIFALVIATYLIPVFNQIAEKDISLRMLFNTRLLLSIFGALILILLFSIVYPSLFVSSFAPAHSMRKLSVQPNLFNFRNSLVIFQFTLSIGLIICSIAISSQLKFINNYDLGYKKDNLIYIDMHESQKAKHEILASEFKKLPGVISLAKADKAPFWGGNSSWGYGWEGKDPEKTVLICRTHVSPSYFETLGIEFAQGNTFSKYFDKVIDQDQQERVEVILNEEAIRQMELQDPIGKQFSIHGTQATIVGITKDFHFQSLHYGVEPMVMVPMQQLPTTLMLRIDPVNFSQTITAIKSIWKETIPDASCEVGFFDQRLKQMYNADIRISGLFRYFTLVAIFIACIGLFGLSLYIIERRKKEIGIRKVNGSKVVEILTLLNRAFIRWVFIAFVIASPLAYIFMRKYLENFAQRTTLSWWIFALAGFLTLAIAVLTVSWQSWRAAIKNPVEALRYE